MADEKDEKKAPQTELQKLQVENQRLLNEAQGMQNEVLRDQIAKMRSVKEAAVRNRAEQERIERFNRTRIAAEQKACPHNKGGRGIEGIFAGNSADRSVIKHTEPWGETYVKCTRCGKEVRDPYFMLRKINPKAVAAAKKKSPKEYAASMRLYRAWLAMPTDNSPSGGTIFGIQREEDMQTEDEEELELLEA